MKHVNGYKKGIRTEDIVRRYQSGESVYSIAKSYETSQSTVIYRLKQSGVYESSVERMRRQEELEGVKCTEELRRLLGDLEARKADSMFAVAEFVYTHCNGCEYATCRCERMSRDGGNDGTDKELKVR